MFSLSFIESFIEHKSFTNIDLSDIIFISGHILNSNVNCVNEMEFEKFRILVIIVKSYWIYFCLCFIIFNCENIKGFDEIQSTVKLEYIGNVIDENISFVLEQINDINTNNFIKNEMINVKIEDFKKELSIIKQAVIEGGEESWEHYINQFKLAIQNFSEVSKLMTRSVLRQCLEASEILDSEDAIKSFRKLKLLLANQVQCKDDLDRCHRFISETNSLYQIIKKSSVNYNKDKIERIINHFADCHEIAAAMKQDFSLCSKCQTIKPVQSKSDNSNLKNIEISVSEKSNESCNNDNDKKDSPVTSCSIGLNKDTIESVKQGENEMQDDVNVDELLTLDGDKEVKMRPYNTRQIRSILPPQGKLENNSNKYEQSDKSVKAAATSSTDDKITKRFWTWEETFLVYRGVQENLTWARIKEKYFKSSHRSNIHIKDRWRNLQNKPDILEQMRSEYEKR